MNCGSLQRRPCSNRLVEQIQHSLSSFRNLGLAKYDQLKQTIEDLLASCGFHLNDNIHH